MSNFIRVAETLNLQYSGANIPLWILRNGNLIEYKATRCPIGAYPVHIDFKHEDIQLENNDKLYMFTDGIYDQINETTNRKYLKDRFRTDIIKNSLLSLKNQKQEILTNLEQWKGKIHQTDDITVIGLKIQK